MYSHTHWTFLSVDVIDPLSEKRRVVRFALDTPSIYHLFIPFDVTAFVGHQLRGQVPGTEVMYYR